MGVATVTGICNGQLPVGVAQTYSLAINDLKLLRASQAASALVAFESLIIKIYSF